MLKLIKEGYTGYFIRLTNNEKDSYDLSIGDTIYRIEKETYQVAKLLGIKKVYDFSYKIIIWTILNLLKYAIAL